MEKPQTKVALKVVKASSQSGAWSSSSSVMVAKASSQSGAWSSTGSVMKASSKENTKPVEIKLHTQQRAAKRAVFNQFVATKLYLLEQQKKQEERIQKIIEEQEIRLMRKEMVPKAQLMPYFDKPFLPRRSERPLTIPREPSLRMIGCRSLRCLSCNELHNFHDGHNMRPIQF